MPRWDLERRHANASSHSNVARKYSGYYAADEFGSTGPEPYWRKPVRVGESSEGSLSGRYGGVGEFELKDLPLQRPQGLRHNKTRRLHVRAGYSGFRCACRKK